MTTRNAVSIREATLADRETLFQIHVDSVTSLCGTHYSRTQIDAWFEGRSPADYTKAIDCGGDWIASIAQEPIGFIEFFTRSISMLYVRGAFSGQGLGRLLLDFALARLPGDEGRIELEALLNAAPFYERFGFKRFGHGELRRPSGLTIETVLMDRRL